VRWRGNGREGKGRERKGREGYRMVTPATVRQDATNCTRRCPCALLCGYVKLFLYYTDHKLWGIKNKNKNKKKRRYDQALDLIP